MRPSEEFHTQKENVVCVCLREVSRTEKPIEIMTNKGKMRNRKFLLGIRFCLRCWKILKTNYSHGYAIVESHLTTWIIHWRIVKWQMLLCSFYWHEVARKETKVISHPGSNMDTDEFSTVVGGSHHLVILISPEHNTRETVFANMYTSPYACPDMYWRVTKKDRKKQNKAWQRYLLVWQGKELKNEPEWPQELSINHLSRQSLVFGIFNYNLIYATFLLHLLF